LVCPAPVVQAAFTGEESGIPVGIVVEHQQYLPAQIRALEIVPLILGRLNAIPDEDDFRSFDARLLLIDAAGSDEVGVVVERNASIVAHEGPLIRRAAGDADERKRLFPHAWAGARLQADELHRAGNVETRERVALGSGSAAGESIVGEKSNRRRQRG